MNIMGIDPGADGAVALIAPDHSAELYGFKGLTTLELWELIVKLSIDPVTCYLELTGPTPHDGVVSAAKFGERRGELHMALTAAKIPFTRIPPGVWQRSFGLGKKFATTTLRKTAHLQRAQELFPHLKILKPRADALLIAEYGYRALYRK